jgi:2-polyprenyl-3-methyl-5-hydroxy-6-metoxy-1,4-benzoquinol methylase
MSQIHNEIFNYYKKFLEREPDDAGLFFYLKKFENGSSLEKIQNDIKFSEESQILKMKKFENKKFNLHSNQSKEEIQKTFQKITRRYHWISVNGVELSDELMTSKAYQMWISQSIPEDLTDKTILDIGCSDGFYSFLCESRNAKNVTAIDFESFENWTNDNYIPNKSNPNNLEIIKNLLDSKVKYHKLDVYDIQKLDQTFDFVLMYGVYYHLYDFVLALQKISDVVTDSVFLSGHILDTDSPIMYYYEPNSKNNKTFSNIVGSSNCLINIALKMCNFKTAECVDIISTDYDSNFSHNNGLTKGKIGLFKFSK